MKKKQKTIKITEEDKDRLAEELSKESQIDGETEELNDALIGDSE